MLGSYGDNLVHTPGTGGWHCLQRKGKEYLDYIGFARADCLDWRCLDNAGAQVERVTKWFLSRGDLLEFAVFFFVGIGASLEVRG